MPLLAMGVLAGLCVVAGVLPGLVIDTLSPVTTMLVDARLPAQAGGIVIAPIDGARSSYSGLLVLVFLAAAGATIRIAMRRFGSGRTRRAPPWDCGFPLTDPGAQYTATSFAQPIRRIFGTVAFGARERLDLPAPGQMRPARLHVTLRDLIWQWLYVPAGGAVVAVAAYLDRLAYLTIRQYLAMVFAALVLLLLMLALWP